MLTGVRARLVVAGLLALTLAGCGGSDSSNQSPDQKAKAEMQQQMFDKMKQGMKGTGMMGEDMMKNMLEKAKAGNPEAK